LFSAERLTLELAHPSVNQDEPTEPRPDRLITASVPWLAVWLDLIAPPCLVQKVQPNSDIMRQVHITNNFGL
jgi:hypothetical protein